MTPRPVPTVTSGIIARNNREHLRQSMEENKNG